MSILKKCPWKAPVTKINISTNHVFSRNIFSYVRRNFHSMYCNNKWWTMMKKVENHLQLPYSLHFTTKQAIKTTCSPPTNSSKCSKQSMGLHTMPGKKSKTWWKNSHSVNTLTCSITEVTISPNVKNPRNLVLKKSISSSVSPGGLSLNIQWTRMHGFCARLIV